MSRSHYLKIFYCIIYKIIIIIIRNNSGHNKKNYKW